MLYINLVIIGVSVGGVYALLGLGLVLIYRSSGVLNFAQTSMAMFSTYVFWEVSRRAPFLTVWGAVIVAVAFGAALGAALYRGIFQRLRNAPPVTRLIASVGVAFILPALARVLWSGQSDTGIRLPAPFGTHVLKFGLAAIQAEQLGLVVVAVAVAIGLHRWMRHSTMGMALRAVSQNRQAAQMLGVPEARVSMTAWAIGGALAALAGVLYLPLQYLDPNQMATMLPVAFAAALLGGLVNLPMSLAGGLALGALESVFRGMHGIYPRLAPTIAALGIVAFLLARIDRFFVSAAELKAIEGDGSGR